MTFFKKNKFIIIAAAAAALTAAVLFAALRSDWPTDRRTRDFPKMKGEIYSVEQTERSTAVYFKNCTESAAMDYIKKLSYSGLDFRQNGFPYSALKGEIFVSVMFTRETGVLSVTFSEREGE